LVAVLAFGGLCGEKGKASSNYMPTPSRKPSKSTASDFCVSKTPGAKANGRAHGVRTLLALSLLSQHHTYRFTGDGSKEWTAEWLEKLDHRFGDDGDFWISYEDLLRKYQAFERTRLFSQDWRVAQLWTSLTIPWALSYHDTYFSFSLTKPGSVVIVLAQLDDRYFRGLEGQYRFELAFRLHKSGQEDYLVRSQAPYRMRRSVNVELELEAGDYDVMVKVDANRYESLLPIEEVIRNSVKERREKLTRIGLAYDLAHGKGKFVETQEEKKARKVHEKKVRDQERRDVKKRILENREEAHYLKTKKLLRDRKKRVRRTDKERAKKEGKKAARRAEKAASGDGLVPIDQDKAMKEPSKNTTEDATGQNGKAVLSDAQNKPADCSFNGRAAQKDSENRESLTVSFSVMGTEAPSNQHDKPGSDPKLLIPSQSRTPNSFRCESESEYGDDSSLDSLSELSDRELDIQIESFRSQMKRPAVPIVTVPATEEPSSVDEFEKDPWNAVAVVGLRIYYKTTEGSADEDVIKLKVVRPSPYSDNEDEESKETEKKEKGKGLDVDDSAKDATLEGGVRDRKKSIVGDQLKRA
jgi:hypothetical protein